MKAPHQLALDGGVVLLVDDVVDAVAVDQQVLLELETSSHGRGCLTSWASIDLFVHRVSNA